MKRRTFNLTESSVLLLRLAGLRWPGEVSWGLLHRWFCYTAMKQAIIHSMGFDFWVESTFTDVTISVDIHAVNDLVAGALVIEGGGRIWGLQWYVICVRLLGRFVSAVARGLSQWFRWGWSMKAAGGGVRTPPEIFQMSFLDRANLLIFYDEGAPKNQRLVKAVSFWWRSHILH